MGQTWNQVSQPMDNFYVGAMILMTASPSFQDREAASAYLKSTPMAWPICFQVSAMKGVDAEMAARCSQVSAWRDVWLESRFAMCKPTSWPIMPPVDYLGELDWQPYLNRAGGYDSRPYWQSYREATELWIRDKLMCNVSVKEIIVILDNAAERDRAYYQEHRDIAPCIIIPLLGEINEK